MRSETVTAVLPAPQKAVFEYISDIEKLPEWATGFARFFNDATGIYALERLAKKCRHEGTVLILCEIKQQPLRAIVRARKLELFGGRQNLAKSLDIALDRARQVLSPASA